MDFYTFLIYLICMVVRNTVQYAVKLHIEKQALLCMFTVYPLQIFCAKFVIIVKFWYNLGEYDVINT